MEHINWAGFKKNLWQDEINVRDFIQMNYKEYTGDAGFLAGALFFAPAACAGFFAAVLGAEAAAVFRTGAVFFTAAGISSAAGSSATGDTC